VLAISDVLQHFVRVLEPFAEVALVASDVLPRNADEACEEDETRVANIAVVIIRVQIAEDRVRNEIALSVRDLVLREAVDVAVDRVEEVDAVPLLLIPAPKVCQVGGRGQLRRSRAFRSGIAASGWGRLTARVAARVVRVGRAYRGRDRQR